MAKMGYVVGTGLGKNGEGRLDPVEAQVLPVGKSLGTQLPTEYMYYLVDFIYSEI